MAALALRLRLAAAEILVVVAAVVHKQAAAAHKPFAAVLVLVAAADLGSMSDNLAAALVVELGLPSSRSSNRHY